MSSAAQQKLKGRSAGWALVLLAAAALPVQAATSLNTADGTTITVEVSAGPLRHRGPEREARALVYSLQTAESIRSGWVGSTVDAARDESPVLAIDPRSGSPILVWSRFDGSSMKIAWARFERGAWRNTRFITFGQGDDRSPAVGTSLAGSFLFWTQGDSVLYAPVDLGTGRLFGAPRPVTAPGRIGGGLRPDGGADAPIVLSSCDHNRNSLCPGPPTPPAGPNTPTPRPPSTEGGTDVPITIPTPTGTPSGARPEVTVASDPVCSTQVLVLGVAGSRGYAIVGFDGSGTIAPVVRVVLSPEVDLSDASSAAGAHYLERLCH